MLNISKRKPIQFFSVEEQNKIVSAIQQAETRTGGQIRVYVEHHCPFHYADALDRAEDVFANLQMQHTQQHNAVLIYVALKDRLLAVYADSGIYRVAGQKFWDEKVRTMIKHFNQENYVEGIAQVIAEIGNALSQSFPPHAQAGINELPDNIVFGK